MKTAMSHSSQDEDCHVSQQSHPSIGDHVRWSKGSRKDVGQRLSHSVTAINWRSHRMEQGFPDGCLVKHCHIYFSHSYQLGIIRVEQGLPEGCEVKTVIFSHSSQVDMIPDGARVAGGMLGKDCHIQSQQSSGHDSRWSKGCRRDVR